MNFLNILPQYLLRENLQELNIDMNIAILICGQPRFTSDFDNLLKNLKGYDHADWFCYFTGDNQSVPHNKLPSEFWRKITDIEKTISHFQSMLPPNNTVRSFELSDSDYINLPKEPHGIPTPAYKMWYNLFKVNQLRLNYEKENNKTYDLVLRVRPDIGLVSELDLKSFNLKYLKSEIITPKNKIAGHLYFSSDSPRMCDLFAIASPENMNIYCDMIHTASKNFYTQTVKTWHTESALALYLRTNNIFITPANFKISIRGDSN